MTAPGIAIGDAISTAPYLKTGELVKPVTEGMVTDDWVSLLTREGARPTPEIDLFCQWLRGEMAHFKCEVEQALELRQELELKQEGAQE